MKKIAFGICCLSLLLMTACDSENETTFDDEFKASIEEEPVQLTMENGVLLLSFYPSEMIYYGMNEYTDNYDMPFEQPEENQDYTEYEDYTVEFDEETDIFSVTTEDGVYELEMLGPRVFWDEKNSLNITSTRSFIEEYDYCQLDVPALPSFVPPFAVKCTSLCQTVYHLLTSV